MNQQAALPLAASPASSSRPVPPNSRLERVIARRQARGALLREPPNTQGEAPPQYEDVEDAAPFLSLPPYTRLEPVFHPDIVSDPCPPFNACAWSTSQLVAPRFDANSAPRVTWPVNAPLFWQAGVLNQINNPNHTVTNLLPPSLGHLPGGNTGAQPSNAHSNAPTQAPGRVGPSMVPCHKAVDVRTRVRNTPYRVGPLPCMCADSFTYIRSPTSNQLVWLGYRNACTYVPFSYPFPSRIGHVANPASLSSLSTTRLTHDY